MAFRFFFVTTFDVSIYVRSPRQSCVVGVAGSHELYAWNQCLVRSIDDRVKRFVLHRAKVYCAKGSCTAFALPGISRTKCFGNGRTFPGKCVSGPSGVPYEWNRRRIIGSDSGLYYPNWVVVSYES